MKLKVKYQEARELWARMLALARLARCWHNDKLDNPHRQWCVSRVGAQTQLCFLAPPPNLGPPLPDLILHWQPETPRLGPSRLGKQPACSLPISAPTSLPRRKASEPLCSFEALISIFLFITLSYPHPHPPAPLPPEWSTGWLVGGQGWGALSPVPTGS